MAQPRIEPGIFGLVSNKQRRLTGPTDRTYYFFDVSVTTVNLFQWEVNKMVDLDYMQGNWNEFKSKKYVIIEKH